MDDAKLMEQRKEKLFHFLKKDIYFSAFLVLAIIALLFSILLKSGVSFFGFFSIKTWFALFVFSSISALLSYFHKRRYVFYPFLAWVVWVALEIRTLNLPYLRDITTGGWTLGPDLDPFLFLRWAKYIVEKGSLMAMDTMRYVPLGFETKGEMIFLSYLITWFHKIAVLFGSISIEQSAALFPTFMFALTVIAFFLLVRKTFIDKLGNNYANLTALIASFFLSVFPVLLPRTISGIPEKESAAFFFLFLSFYFFLCAWKSPKLKYQIPLAILAGLATAGMALVWGGVIFVFFAISLAVIIAFIFGQINNNKVISFALWLFSALAIMNIFSTRYTISSYITSITTQIPFIVLGALVFHLIFIYFIKPKVKSEILNKLPSTITSLIIFIVIAFIAALFIFGPSFIFSNIAEHVEKLTNPAPTDRISITVAENRVPYFSEWTSSFGPHIKNLPIMFWLFAVGSVFLFYALVSSLDKKEKWILAFAYVYFISGIIFSRIEPSSLFNGSNFISQAFYFSGILVLFGAMIYYYYLYTKAGKSEQFTSLDFGLILSVAFFFFCLVSVRGAIRLVMMLAPSASLFASYLLVALIKKVSKKKEAEDKESLSKLLLWASTIIVLLLVVFSAYNYYAASLNMARGYVPSSYNQQWQKAMSWVRENVPENAVFAHWWDYGYWVQTLGQRATILDGGNAIGYWNHLMGRHVLTAPNNQDALEFLYTHNGTHLLIDPTDIGKYTAFSSIGSDENYDRRSWISTFVKDSRQTQETKNSTIYVYGGGFVLDGDIVYDNNGTKVFLPAQKAGVGAIILERNSEGRIIKNPEAIFVYQQKQYNLPIRYAFDGKFIDFNSGIEAGIFLFPVFNSQTNQIESNGALLYLSNKTVKSQLARLYLYKEENPYFKLVHSEDDFFVSQIKTQMPLDSDFVFTGDFRGPIRIWEVSYPKNIKANPQYLLLDYPDKRLQIS